MDYFIIPIPSRPCQKLWTTLMKSRLYKKTHFYSIYIYIIILYMSMCIDAWGRQKRAPDPLNMVVVTHDMGARTQTPVLCNNRKDCQLLSHHTRAQVWLFNIICLKLWSYLGSAIAAFRRLMMNFPWWKAIPFCTWLFSDTGYGIWTSDLLS